MLLAALLACDHDAGEGDPPGNTTDPTGHTDLPGTGDTGDDGTGYVPDGNTTGSAEMCLFLAGGKDRVRGPDEGLPLGNTGRTLQGWVRSGNPAEQIALSYGRPSPGQGVQLGTTSGYPIFRLGPSDLEVLTGDVFVGDDRWHHLAASWDGTTAVILVDGQIAGVGPLSGSTLEGDLMAGNTPTGDDTKPWMGWLDDLKVVYGPRTPEEIAADPDALLVPEEELLMWWDFELPEGSGGIGLEVPDESGNGHDGLTAGVDVGSPRFLRCR